MSYKIYNPYQNLGKEFTEGMDYIIKNVPKPTTDVTFEQLNETLLKYFQTIFKPTVDSSIINNVVLSILPNTANSYQNSNLRNDSFYNQEQILLLNSISESIKGNDVEGILSVLNNANQEIAESGLSAVDQTPLFIAVEMGKRSYEYWLNTIYDTKSSWIDLLNKNTAINVANLPFLVTTSMEGALSGFAQIQQLDMNVATSLNSLGRSIATMSAVIAAVGLSSGKMFFKWVKKINTAKLSLNKETIVKLNTVNNQYGRDTRGYCGTIYCDKTYGTKCEWASINICDA
ncbi:MAG: hypothetical protein KFKLKKLM_00714 [Flavobacteriales bacterium]|nr:hypothetical protein [Flavobacteriales bacterium]